LAGRRRACIASSACRRQPLAAGPGPGHHRARGNPHRGGRPTWTSSGTTRTSGGLARTVLRTGGLRDFQRDPGPAAQPPVVRGSQPRRRPPTRLLCCGPSPRKVGRGTRQPGGHRCSYASYDGRPGSDRLSPNRHGGIASPRICIVWMRHPPLPPRRPCCIRRPLDTGPPFPPHRRRHS
jgi:hypothetical protein